jgi:arylsulfatase A-like enzyme
MDCGGIPLIAHYPDVIEENQVSDVFIGQYDLMPTILDMAGVDVAIPNSSIPMLMLSMIFGEVVR